MKTIGKIAVLAMTMSLAFVLTACGGSASSSAASSSASASAASASASTSASASSASAASSAASDDANAYVNDFFGLKFNLPEGWSFVDAASLKGANEVIAAAAANAQVDMVAMNADKSQIVIAGIEKASDKTAGMTAEKYLEAEEQEMTTSIGGNYSLTSTSAEVTFAGIDRKLPASITTLNVNGAKLVICQTVAEKDGSFFSAIAMGASEEEVTKAFENFAATTV